MERVKINVMIRHLKVNRKQHIMEKMVSCSNRFKEFKREKNEAKE